MQIFLGILFTVLAFLAIYKIKMYNTKGINKNWFIAMFSIKLILSIGLFAMYSRSPEIKSNADIFRFYNDAQVIYNSLKTQPSAFFKIMTGINSDSEELLPYYQKMNNWDYSFGSKLYANNKLLIRYLALISILTFGSYYAATVITIFLSFTGLFWIFRFFNYMIKDNKWLILFLIFLTPSIAFWSSGILKESLLIFLIGLLINCGSLALRGRNPFIRIIIVAISLIFIFEIKAILALILIPAILSYLWNHYFPKQRTFIPYFIIFFIGFSFASESGKYMNKGFFELLQDKQAGFISVTQRDNSQSLISSIDFQPNSISIASNAPIAIINVLFRPALWEANNLQSYFASFENVAISLSILLIIIFPTKEINNKNLLLFTLSISLSYIIIIGLSVPVLGAISRYRIIALIFLEMSLIQIININRIKELILNKQTNIHTNK